MSTPSTTWSLQPWLVRACLASITQREVPICNMRQVLTPGCCADVGSEAVHRKLDWAKQQREKGLFTVPSTIAEELTYNPFLRTSDAAALAKLRSAKDNFGLTARLITGVLTVASAASNAAKALGLR